MYQGVEGFVFIVTYGRSGSTLLQTILQSINGYCIRGENNNVLWPLYQSVCALADARADHGHRPMAPHEPWFGIDQVDAERYARRVVDLFLEEVIQPPEDARVLGFKEIRFHRAGADRFEPFLNFIASHMAPAKFIFNCRPWQQVARSGWWQDCDEVMVRDLVETADALYADYAAKHPAHCFIARYDDYSGNPDYWRDLFEFLGEPFDPDRIRALSERKLTHQ